MFFFAFVVTENVQTNESNEVKNIWIHLANERIATKTIHSFRIETNAAYRWAEP